MNLFLKFPFRSLESELVTVRQEKESLTQQLLNTIKQKVALSQELEAWQVCVPGYKTTDSLFWKNGL